MACSLGFLFMGGRMDVDAANANELAETAGEVGAEVLTRDLSYPSETGSWQLGDLDLGEHLERYHGKRLVLIIAPVGDAPSPTYTCGICGFVMNEVGECPRCKLQAIEFEREVQQRLAERTPDVFEQVRELLDEQDEDGGPG
jgi:hypothetical protein